MCACMGCTSVYVFVLMSIYDCVCMCARFSSRRIEKSLTQIVKSNEVELLQQLSWSWRWETDCPAALPQNWLILSLVSTFTDNLPQTEQTEPWVYQFAFNRIREITLTTGLSENKTNKKTCCSHGEVANQTADTWKSLIWKGKVRSVWSHWRTQVQIWDTCTEPTLYLYTSLHLRWWNCSFYSTTCFWQL